MQVSLIAAALRTESERTLCRYGTPWAPGWVSPDPTPRRSDSPLLSSAADLETAEREGRRKIMMEEVAGEGSGVSGEKSTRKAFLCSALLS